MALTVTFENISMTWLDHLLFSNDFLGTFGLPFLGKASSRKSVIIPTLSGFCVVHCQRIVVTVVVTVFTALQVHSLGPLCPNVRDFGTSASFFGDNSAFVTEL